MPWWWSLAALAALFALVAVRRLEARRWNAKAHHAPGPTTVRRVWFQGTPPRAAFFAFADRKTGTLRVHTEARCADITFRDGTVETLAKIRAVQMGGRGSDFVNTWIEVVCNPPPGAAYLNDGKLFGWWALVSGSNQRIADSLANLVADAEDAPLR